MKSLFSRTTGHLLAAAVVLTAGLTGCVNDLNREPYYEVNTETIYRDPANYVGLLAKLYASFNLGGQTTTGTSDVTFLGRDNDEGAASYLRSYWTLQQVPTDETALAWNDPSLQDLNKQNWNSGNQVVRFCYNRIFYSISVCNGFIRETTDDKLSKRGIDGANAVMARQYRAEARFLRALAYWHAIDLYGSVPFVTEADAPGNYLPPQISRKDLFAYIERELKAISGSLLQPHQASEYGHADKAAAWMLLARLYLNAEVYIGENRAAECITYCDSIVQKDYALSPAYRNIFLADNNVTAASEIIFPITCDGLNEQTYGGTTFIVHSSIGDNMTGFGVNNAWSGNRTRKTLPLRFSSVNGNPDKRSFFFISQHTLEIKDLVDFKQGYATNKFKNITSTNQPGKDQTFVDTDFPMFRLADVYLMYAEALLRTNGDRGKALDYVNRVRRRSNAVAITDADLSLDYLLEERSRELYWEAQRRTDLIRFGKFTGPGAAYPWPFKGGDTTGMNANVDAKFNVFPIPASDIVANPTLKQSVSGY